MGCELVLHAKAKTLTVDEFREQTEIMEQVLDTDHFDVSVAKCRECGQLFINCFREYTTADFDDDCWSFWMPVEMADVEEMKSAQFLMKFIGDLLRDRGNICWHPNGKMFWNEHGFDLACLIFLP